MNLIVNLLPEIDQKDHWHTKTSSSKVLCVGVIAALDNNQNHSQTLLCFQKHDLEAYVLDEGQFSRRIRRLTEYIPRLVEQIALLAQAGLSEFPLKQIEKDMYVIDTKPIPICQNIRIHKSHLAKNHLRKETVKTKQGKFRRATDDDYRGYCASKREYYYGFKLNLLQDCLSIPREYSIHPGSAGDVDCLKSLNLNLPNQAEILGDKIYEDNFLEESLAELYGLKLEPIRKKNSKKMFLSDYTMELAKSSFRESIETTFSFFTNRIRAVSLDGFVTKIHLAVVGRSIAQLFKLDLLAIWVS